MPWSFFYFSIVKLPLGSVGDAYMGHGIFKANNIAHNITTTSLRCFFNLKHHAFAYYPTINMNGVENASACIYP